MSRINATYATQLLEQGDLVALPTETVYGLAARIDSEASLKQIFAVKGRPFFDPLIVHVASRDQAQALTTEWPSLYDLLTEAFWPGPLTLIAPRSDQISPLITSGLDSVALRCPRHPLTLKILTDLKVPLAAPSANRFGHTSPTSAAHVEQEFGDEIPIVDGGVCEIGLESTVLNVHKAANGKWLLEILRPGGISRAQLSQVLNGAKISHNIERRESQVSPGHLKHHYQPDSALIITGSTISNEVISDEEILTAARERLNIDAKMVHWLHLDSDPRQAARTLYQSFRVLSAANAVIAVKKSPQTSGEDWEAIWDRIGRAASLNLTSYVQN